MNVCNIGTPDPDAQSTPCVSWVIRSEEDRRRLARAQRQAACDAPLITRYRALLARRTNDAAPTQPAVATTAGTATAGTATASTAITGTGICLPQAPPSQTQPPQAPRHRRYSHRKHHGCRHNRRRSHCRHCGACVPCAGCPPIIGAFHSRLIRSISGQLCRTHYSRGLAAGAICECR